MQFNALDKDANKFYMTCVTESHALFWSRAWIIRVIKLIEECNKCCRCEDSRVVSYLSL